MALESMHISWQNVAALRLFLLSRVDRIDMNATRNIDITTPSVCPSVCP